MATVRFHNTFCIEVRRLLIKEVAPRFGDNENRILSRQVTDDWIIIPHALKQRVLHIHNYARLAGHSGGRIVQESIGKEMHWPVLAVVRNASV